MSFETALAITNQKTIKDENKDKLKDLCFMVKIIENEFKWSVCSCEHAYIVCVYFCVVRWRRNRICMGTCIRVCACVHVCVSERVSEWAFVCNHVRQAVMNGVFETERSVEFLGLDQIGNRKTNIP